MGAPEETAALAVRVGEQLSGGDTLLLEGDLGSGKTLFARALIQSRLQVPEDVPSPTFTLVQTYAAGGTEIWHADLYRLGHGDEAIELGLVDAFESAICLVEWPERLEDLAPEDALTICFEQGEEADARDLSFHYTHPKWDARLADV